MAFEVIEESRDLGQPYELYLFKYGSDSTAAYGYTDGSVSKTHLGVAFKPLPIKRGTIVANQGLDKTTLQVRMPRDAEVPALYTVQAPSYVVSLTIFQGHHNDPDNELKVVWTGRVQSVQRTGSLATVSCTPASASMKRVGLRYNYQHPCQHPLYGEQCGANKLAATVTANAVEIGEDFIRLPVDWFGALPEDKFVYGIAEWQTSDNIEYRSILEVTSGGVLRLTNKARGLVPGMPVKVSLGCNHQVTDCKNLHSNLQNYGGMPYIPLKNPINKNNHH